ncbi:hypothetical protein QOV31_005191 (plasmid) [Agrobacterium fabrum]|nr:hypothetical protein QOV31_005191 [Agrobacterium fabrum]
MHADATSALIVHFTWQSASALKREGAYLGAKTLLMQWEK